MKARFFAPVQTVPGAHPASCTMGTGFFTGVRWPGPGDPPIMIMNRTYVNQNLLYIVPLIRHTIVVCIISISPVAMVCFICVNINVVIVLKDISNFVMSGGILFKMLILGINEMASCLSSEVLKGCG